jgi:mannose-6-phosphate isomerase-like protein (cupin superfamily)
MEYFTSHKFQIPITKDVVARDWRHRGYSCDWFVDPPGQQWNNFVHHCNELVTVVEGLLELSFAGQSWVVQPGDEVFIPEGAVHSVKNIHTDTTRWLYGYD